jgi:formiminotetrahydrofolate cyclodeaminase
MTHLAQESISQLYREAASIEPAPGGGAVTALCGMLGVALVLKALRISLKRRDDAARFRPADEALESLASSMAEDADADAEAYGAYIAAVRLPKEPAEAAAARSARLQETGIGSTEAALLALEHAALAMDQARALAPEIGQQMAPDLDAGLALLEIMRSNAAHNAEANLAGVRDAATHAALARRLAAARFR